MTVAEFSCQPDDVASLFGSLFHAKVTVTAAAVADHSASDKILAVFRNDDGELVGVCKADFEFAARAAAALTMIPVGGCDDVIEEGVLDASYMENASEIMNLMATLISMPGSKRAFMAGVIEAGQLVPDDVTALLESQAFCSTLKTNFAGYGDGVFSFYG